MYRTAVELIRTHRWRTTVSALAVALLVAGHAVLAGLAASDIASQAGQRVRASDRGDLVVVPSGLTSDAGRGFTTETVSRVDQLPGSAAAEGVTEAGGITLSLADGQRATETAVASVAIHAGLRPDTGVSGRLPDRPGEAVLDRETADRYGLRPGTRFTVALGRTALDVTLVGTVTPSRAVYLRGVPQLWLVPADALAVAGTDRYDRITVAVADGADPTAVAAAVRSVLGSGAKLLTRAEFLDRLRDEVVRANDLDELVVLQIVLLVATLIVAAAVVTATLGRALARRTRGPAGPTIAAVALAGSLAGLLAVVAGLVLATGVLALAALGSSAFASAPWSAPAPALAPLAGGLFAQVAIALLATTTATVLPAWRATRTGAAVRPASFPES